MIMKKETNSIVGNKKPLDIKVKISMIFGVGLIVTGLGYLTWHSVSHNTATAVKYDEFPEWISASEADEDYIPSEMIHEQTGIETVNIAMANPDYSWSDVNLTNQFESIAVGTAFASITGKNEDLFTISYKTVCDNEDGWSSEPLAFTVSFDDVSHRMKTLIYVDDKWQDISNESVELESGKEYDCLAYSDAGALTNGISVRMTDTEYTTTQLALN